MPSTAVCSSPLRSFLAASHPRAALITFAGVVSLLGAAGCRDSAAPPRQDRTGAAGATNGATNGATPTAKGASVSMDTPLGDTDVRVTMDALVEKTLRDPQAVDAQYQLKTMEAVGVVLAVELGDPKMVKIVVGKQLGGRDTPCVCQGNEQLRAAASALTPGQPITVRGKFAGMVQMALVLLNCEVVPGSPPADSATNAAPGSAG